MAEHPHFTKPSPPKRWMTEADAKRDLPKLIPSLQFDGDPELIPPHFAEISIEDALKHFFADSPFAVASTDFEGADTDYGHLFIRDAEYGNTMLDGTRFLKTIGRPELGRDFVIDALQYQGQNDRPNAKITWANDGEKPGRIPHEIWHDYESNDNARYLNDELGWQFPIYFGSVDTTPMMAMRIAREAAKDSAVLQATVAGDSGDSVLDRYTAAIQHIVDESRVTKENPEGIYETAAMSNLCWGDWDDSYDVIRTKDGRPAEGRVAHTQLQVFARSALLGFINATEGSQVDSELIDEARATADRLGTALTEHFLIEDDPTYGTYFALGTDRDPATNQLRKLDICSAKPGLMLLVEPEHLPLGVTEIVINQIMNPNTGLLFSNGIANVSKHDEFWGDEIYHGGNTWPDKNGLLALGMERQGAHGLATELHQRNWSNFTDKWVRGFHEFLRSSNDDILTVQRDVPVSVKDSQPKWAYRAIKHAMGGQFWALCAAARAVDRLDKTWSGELPHRATDPAMAQFEAVLMEKIEAFDGLRTAASFRRDDAKFFEDRTTIDTETNTSKFVEGAVELRGQRMPGENAKGRSVADGFSIA